jgi:hypothetical protein
LAGYLSDLWRQLGDIGKVIVVGWIVGLSLIISIIIYDYATIVSAEQVPPFTTQLLVPLADATTKSNSVQEDEFTSTSSSRTTFTAASGKTTASYSTYKTTDTGNSNSNQDRLPEHLQILSYLYPNGSFWPAHYITACKNAEMTMSRQEDDLALVTYDTPCSSNTRRSKAETIRQLKGKITLSRKAVERDLREGLVGYREGVVEMVSMSTDLIHDLISREIGRGSGGLIRNNMFRQGVSVRTSRRRAEGVWGCIR